MASTEKRLRRGSAGETAGSFHAANYHSSCAEEDLGDLHDPLEEAEVAELDPHVPTGSYTVHAPLLVSIGKVSDGSCFSCSITVLYGTAHIQILVKLPGVPWTSSSRGRRANQTGATGATAMAKWSTWRRKIAQVVPICLSRLNFPEISNHG